MTETTNSEVKISPAKDRRVRHENGGLLEPKSDVVWSPYWERRANDGDIIVHAAADQAASVGEGGAAPAKTSKKD